MAHAQEIVRLTKVISIFRLAEPAVLTDVLAGLLTGGLGAKPLMVSVTKVWQKRVMAVPTPAAVRGIHGESQPYKTHRSKASCPGLLNRPRPGDKGSWISSQAQKRSGAAANESKRRSLRQASGFCADRGVALSRGSESRQVLATGVVNFSEAL